MGIAVVNADGLVVTVVRDDVPDGWQPPEGCAAIPEADLPAGWQRAPEPVPQSITARQIRLWLVRRWLLSAVDSAIDGIADHSQRESVRVEWSHAPYIERSHPWLMPLAAALGLSEADVDQAFREAASL